MNFDKITEYLDSLEEKGIPSVDCIISENHRQLYRHMNGTTDGSRTKKVTGNEQYLMFSMTKVQTMAAVMQLVEKGVIDLEDPVSKFLPAYGRLTVGVGNSENPVTANGMTANEATAHADYRVEPVTVPLKIKHLLSMQSGLDYDLNRPGIVRVLKEKGAKATTLELVNSFVESPLKFQPGEHFEYSLSHDVAAAVVEVVSGMKFGEYLKKNIWTPLHMEHTFFAKPMNGEVENLATQFIVNEAGKIEPMEPSCNYQLSENYQSGGAGLISSTEDYARFADAVACGGVSEEGERILKPETIERMKQNLLGEAGLRDIETKMGRKGYGYGCGVQVLMHPELIGSNAPAGVFGWDGAAGSCIIMDTKSKRSLVYTQHVRNCGMAYAEIHPTLRDMMFS